MNQRETNKDLSYKKILEAAASRIREQGLSGAGIALIMKDAGLTNGAFYAHFSNKNELVEKAFSHALVDNRPRWIKPADNESWGRRLKRLAARYLTGAHRDNLSDSCALAALTSDAGRAGEDFKKVYEKELYQSLEAVCEGGATKTSQAKQDEALMFMALCVGGMSLSRAVADTRLSNRILEACRTAAERLSIRTNPSAEQGEKEARKSRASAASLPEPDDFPWKTHEKLRYADTDRQGHVNNAVFSTMLETGRVEILYDPVAPLYKEDCSFVIARQTLNYQSEITWPGRVDIGTKIVSIGKSSIGFEHGLFQDGRCAATANVIIVQVNDTAKRSEPLTATAVERLSQLMD
ncbi:MAG: TetR family transcriptional regulator [Desulfobacterales bacterium]|nr:TetR family transcriptional regulator [Desulfobacterales bacterium]